MSLDLLTIFSHSAGLDQSGRCRNTVHCFGKEVFILSNDSTVLLRFECAGDMNGAFPKPISFSASDYDSSNFKEKNGQIIFVKVGEEFTRQKTCGKPELSFQGVKEIWRNLLKKWKEGGQFSFLKESLTLVEESLSHLEFSAKSGVLQIIQRDIFSGTTITLTRRTDGLVGELEGDKNLPDFAPIGMRTSDFTTLFAFQQKLIFHVPAEPIGYFKVRGDRGLQGFISNCNYDELGTVTYLKEPDSKPEKEKSFGEGSSLKRKAC